MSTKVSLPIKPEQNIPREHLIALLNTAIELNSNRFARELAIYWLAYFPGDLPVSLLYAKALLQNRQFKYAKTILDKVCRTDPEYLEAHITLASMTQNLSSVERLQTQWNIYALCGNCIADEKIPEWVQNLRNCRLALTQNDCDHAESLIHKTLLASTSSPLVAITHLQVCVKCNFPADSLLAIAKLYKKKYPDTVGIALILADAMMRCGDHEEALALIHESAASDVIGQVARRLWGENNPYKRIWTSRLEIPLDIPIPIEIAATLGYNKLPSGEHASSKKAQAESEIEISTDHPNHPVDTYSYHTHQEETIESNPEEKEIEKPILENDESVEFSECDPLHEKEQPNAINILPDSLRSVQETFEWVANRVKKIHLARVDGRFPVYVILTTRKGIQKFYPSSATTLEREMINLAAAIKSSQQWDALVLFVDESHCMQSFGLKPAKFDDPWEIKLALTDLDKALSKRGEMIGAVLIVGGPEIVPFHQLPNPVDDADEDVASDNPYATRDENYFIPEWAVGRLPGGSQSNAELLLTSLRAMSAYHRQNMRHHSWYERYRIRLNAWLNFKLWKMRPSWGYTAAIWRRASFSVFRPIGQPHAMLITPPVQINEVPGKTLKNGFLPTARLGYFNLHGLPDTSEWYGQRDPTEQSDQPDYPIALRPQDVPNNGKAPQIVFTEACYGAFIQNKKIEEALAFKFLASGTRAFIGSTCISYGSISPPLVSADLLGNIFWKYIQEGLTAGEALRRAKIHLAREMMQRQGYLDGEDQKTLISFVLYGDPLAQANEHLYSPAKIMRSQTRIPFIQTVCDRTIPTVSSNQPQPIPEETLNQIKQWVAQYLPGMSDANVCITQERFQCQGEGHDCPTSQLGNVVRKEPCKERKVITLSKSVAANGKNAKFERPLSDESIATTRGLHIHRHYVRITLDDNGNILKMVMSR
jgi:tetratricopeptide (TPR) repeat protein